MKRTPLLIAVMVVSTTLTIGAASATATARSSSSAPVMALPIAKSAGHVLTMALPRGAYPAMPPRPGVGLRGLHSANSIGCYDNESLLSEANGNLVSAELGYTGSDSGMLRARATAIGPWERFALCYDYNYAMLRARAISIGPWEQYHTSTGRIGC